MRAEGSSRWMSSPLRATAMTLPRNSSGNALGQGKHPLTVRKNPHDQMSTKPGAVPKRNFAFLRRRDYFMLSHVNIYYRKQRVRSMLVDHFKQAIQPWMPEMIRGLRGSLRNKYICAIAEDLAQISRGVQFVLGRKYVFRFAVWLNSGKSSYVEAIWHYSRTNGDAAPFVWRCSCDDPAGFDNSQ